MGWLGAETAARNQVAEPGHPLQTGAREDLEGRFRHTFADVRVHSDAEAGRSALLGGILGSVGGAALGAVGGAMLGSLLDPVGAVVGGVAGGIAGSIGGAALIGKLTTHSRHLKAEEITYAREIFRDSIDYSQVTITRDSIMAAGAPRTVGNTINLSSSWNQFVGDTLDLSQTDSTSADAQYRYASGMVTLIHEMGHVWQYQNGGLRYIPDSIIAQIGPGCRAAPGTPPTTGRRPTGTASPGNGGTPSSRRGRSSATTWRCARRRAACSPPRSSGNCPPSSPTCAGCGDGREHPADPRAGQSATTG